MFISSLEKKEIDKIQKWRIFVTFLILTFKLYESITKQIKTCPNRQVLKLCLRGGWISLARHKVPAVRKFVVIRTARGLFLYTNFELQLRCLF